MYTEYVNYNKELIDYEFDINKDEAVLAAGSTLQGDVDVPITASEITTLETRRDTNQADYNTKLLEAPALKVRIVDSEVNLAVE
jgi:hypothetical protein